ncbi:MAG: hypothetical protein WA183_09215, partial [Chthoniobacterales bacterium]
QTYLEIKDKALALERLYADNKVVLPNGCDLARLIADAKSLSDHWLTNHAKLDMTLLCRTSNLNRIADIVLHLRSVTDRAKYLTLLTCGNLDSLDRQRSTAKDALWELELWSELRRHGLDAELQEPPDIVVSFEGLEVGLACKKFYSERHVQDVLSEAVKQMESRFEFAIVAVNLEELLPADQFLSTATHETMGKYLDDFNSDFLRRHDRHFRKYLATGRVVSVLVSTSVLAHVQHGRPPFNYARQSIHWMIPGLEAEKEKQLKRFYDKLLPPQPLTG